MSATLTSPTAVAAARTERPAYAPIPFRRIVRVELRKMFDTRSGFWLMAAIVGLAVIATGAVILFGSDADLTYDNFGGAVGIPMAVLLPFVAVLSVTSEWSQRSGLSTFTLVPHRGRVIAAKALVSVAVGIVSIAVAFGVGALGNLLGAGIAGIDPVWDMGWQSFVLIVLGNVLGLLTGFAFGLLLRSSAGAVVAYFVFGFVLPPLSMLLAQAQDWFHDAQMWVDFNMSQSVLFNGGGRWPSATEWAQLGTSGLIWLGLPLALGLALVMRSEVK